VSKEFKDKLVVQDRQVSLARQVNRVPLVFKVQPAQLEQLAKLDRMDSPAIEETPVSPVHREPVGSLEVQAKEGSLVHKATLG